MDRNTVIETAYETIKESLEWADSYKDTYSLYIDGIVSVTDALLDKFDEKKVNINIE